MTRAKLLIVDDEEPMARRLCELLDAAGYASRYDGSPEGALRHLREERVMVLA